MYVTQTSDFRMEGVDRVAGFANDSVELVIRRDVQVHVLPDVNLLRSTRHAVGLIAFGANMRELTGASSAAVSCKLVLSDDGARVLLMGEVGITRREHEHTASLLCH
jgi:hypothetical protein